MRSDKYGRICHSSFLTDRRRPDIDLLACHVALGRLTRIDIAPAVDIDKVLRPREERAPAEALFGWRRRRLGPEPAGELVHEPVRHLRALGRIDEPEEDEMAEKDPPVRVEARAQPP